MNMSQFQLHKSAGEQLSQVWGGSVFQWPAVTRKRYFIVQSWVLMSWRLQGVMIEDSEALTDKFEYNPGIFNLIPGWYQVGTILGQDSLFWNCWICLLLDVWMWQRAIVCISKSSDVFIPGQTVVIFYWAQSWVPIRRAQIKWASVLEGKLEQHADLKLGSTGQPAQKWVATGSSE